jgi:hypothetical protein
MLMRWMFQVGPMLSSRGRRERIIVFGDYGSGKSQVWVDWAKMLRDTGSKSQVRVICTDMGAEASTEQYQGWEQNVRVCHVERFDDYVCAVKMARDEDGQDDLLVVDRSDTAWDAVQSAFSLDVSGKDLDDWAVERLSKGEDNPFIDAHGVSWGIIKRRYQEKFVGPLIRYPGHVLLCANEKAVVQPSSVNMKGGDPEDVRDFYQGGMRPGGEKHTGFLMHDIVRLRRKGSGSWVMSTVRARSRKELLNVPLSNFVTDYLMTVGGWDA